MIAKVRRPRRLTFEEGPPADWLARELRSSVDELVVCEPRRKSWIARDGDKDDPIDARKLADLYRGGYLKPVHQSETLGRSLLKQQVSLYHDRVKERVRQGINWWPCFADTASLSRQPRRCRTRPGIGA